METYFNNYISCQEHKKEPITNFCTEGPCLKFLCPECIEVHSSMHANHAVRPSRFRFNPSRPVSKKHQISYGRLYLTLKGKPIEIPSWSRIIQRNTRSNVSMLICSDKVVGVGQRGLDLVNKGLFSWERGWDKKGDVEIWRYPEEVVIFKARSTTSQCRVKDARQESVHPSVNSEGYNQSK